MNNKNKNTKVIFLSYKEKVINLYLITNYIFNSISNLFTNSRYLIVIRYLGSIPIYVLGFEQRVYV